MEFDVGAIELGQLDLEKDELTLQEPDTEPKARPQFDPGKIDTSLLGTGDPQENMRKARLQENYGQALGVTPAAAVRAMEISEKSGVPVDLIGDNADMLERDIKKHSLDIDTFDKEAPNASDFFNQNPQYVQVVQNDFDLVRSLEQTVRGIKQYGSDIAAGFDSGKATQESRELTPIDDMKKMSGIESKRDMVSRENVKNIAAASGYDLGTRVAPFSGTVLGGGYDTPIKKMSMEAARDQWFLEHKDELSALQKRMAGGEDTIEDRSFIAGIPIAVAQQLYTMGYDMVGGVKGAAIGGIVGLAGGAGIPATVPAGASIGFRLGMAKEMYDGARHMAEIDFLQMKDENGNSIDVELAATAANLLGLVSAGLESFSYGKALDAGKAAIRNRIRGALSTERGRKLLSETAQKLGISMATEMTTEVLQSLSEITTKSIIQSLDESAFPEMNNAGDVLSQVFSKETGDELMHVAERTSQVVFGFAGAGTATTMTLNAVRRDDMAENEEAQIEEIGNIVAASETLGISPEVFRQLFSAIDGESDTHVYLDPLQLKLYLMEQDGNDPAVQLLQKHLNNRDTEQAQTDVAIPLADFATDFGKTEHFAALQPHMTLSQETASPFTRAREQKEMQDEIQRHLDLGNTVVDQHKEAKTARDALLESIMATKSYSQASAKNFATVMVGYAQSRSSRTGEPLMDIINREFPSLAGPHAEREQRIKEKRDLLLGDKEVPYTPDRPIPVTELAEEAPEELTPDEADNEPTADEPAVAGEPDTIEQEVVGLQVVEAPVDEITLSGDVPQFKEGADESGVVEPLEGQFERTGVAPIQVWVREDGRKEVISGRHRLDLAKRSGEDTIPAQYHYEADGFGADQAAVLDAMLNIREGQGKVKDYVDFIHASKLTEEEAHAQGILARQTGRRAYTIATKGSDALITAHRNDVITDEGAARIAEAAPNNEALQAVGIKAIQEGKTIAVADNLIRAVQSMTSDDDQGGGDLFGFDDSAMIEAERMAKAAVAKQNRIQRTLSAVQGAAKRPELAAAEGVDVKDPKAVKERIKQLKAEKAEWKEWHTNPALAAELRADADVLAQLSTFEQREWQSAANKGLDMSHEARMARAVAMGFDVGTTYYHGTNTEFAEFDKGTIGDNFTDSMDGGFFFTQSVKRAAGFGEKTIPVFLKSDDALVVKKPEVDERFEDPDFPTSESYNPIDVYDRNNADLLQDARQQGKKAIKVEGFKNDDLMVIFNPANIRSVNAAFDPDFAESADLLAQRGAADLPDRMGVIRYIKGRDGRTVADIIEIASAVTHADISTPDDLTRFSDVMQEGINSIENVALVVSSHPDKLATAWDKSGKTYRVIRGKVNAVSTADDSHSELTDAQGLTLNTLSSVFRDVRNADPAEMERQRVRSIRTAETRRRQDRIRDVPTMPADFNAALQELAVWADNFEEFREALNPNMLDISDRNLTRLSRATMALEPDEYETASGEQTIYRALPAGENIEAGDWVSFDKQYASSHESNVGEEGGTTTEITVDGSEVYWYGADENEWVYIPDNTWDVGSLEELWSSLSPDKPLAYPEVEGGAIFAQSAKQAVIDQQPKNLVVTHNLSAENILAANDLGGLAAPSIAVIRTDKSSFDSFGEVSLLAEPELLESEKVRTFDADVYSPRQPKADFKIDRKAYYAFENQLDPDNLGLGKPDINEAEGGPDNILRSVAVELLWLQEQGKAPKLKNAKVEPTVRAAAKLDVIQSQDEKFQAAAKKHYEQKLKTIAEKLPEEAGRFREMYFLDNGKVKPNSLYSFESEVRRFKRSGGKDVSRFTADITKKMRAKANRDAYEAWVTDKFNEMVKGQRIFKGYTDAGDKKYSPYTMQNVVKEMTQQLQAGEASFYGAGSVRARYAKELKGLKAVQARREQIKSTEDVTELKQDANSVLENALEDLREFYKFDQEGYRYIDDASHALAEGPGGIAEAFEVTSESTKIIGELIQYLVGLPTEYFEAKAQRPVAFSEFHTAVVPKGMNKKALQVLKDAGLKIKYYDGKGAGKSRQEVVAAQDNLFFQSSARRNNIGLYSGTASVVEGLKLPQWKKKKVVVHPDRDIVKQEIADIRERASRANEDAEIAALGPDADKALVDAIEDKYDAMDKEGHQLALILVWLKSKPWMNREQAELTEDLLRNPHYNSNDPRGPAIAALHKAEAKAVGTAKGPAIWQKLQGDGRFKEEKQWMGLQEFLEADPDKGFTREDVLEFVNNNGLNIKFLASNAEGGEGGSSDVVFSWEETIDEDPDYWDDRSRMMEEELDEAPDMESMGWIDWLNDPQGMVDDYLSSTPRNEWPATVQSYQQDIDDAYSAHEAAAIKDLQGAEVLKEALREKVDVMIEETARTDYLEDDPVTDYYDDQSGITIRGTINGGYEVSSVGGEIAYDVYDFEDAEAAAQNHLTGGSEEGGGDFAARHETPYFLGGIPYTNYREQLLTLPDVEGKFVERAHFDEPNVVSFMRVTDRQMAVTAVIDPSEESVAAKQMRSKLTLKEKERESQVDFSASTPPESLWMADQGMNYGSMVRYDRHPSARTQIEAAWNDPSATEQDRRDLYQHMAGRYVETEMANVRRESGRPVGVKHYHVDETQSDWHQAGQKEGYEDSADTIKKLEAEVDAIYAEVEKTNTVTLKASTERMQEAYPERSFAGVNYRQALKVEYGVRVLGADRNGDRMPVVSEEVSSAIREDLDSGWFEDVYAPLREKQIEADAKHSAAAKALNAAKKGVPDAPFKKDAWMALALKKSLVEAVESGAEAFSYSDAQTMVERWSAASVVAYHSQYDEKMPSILKKLTGMKAEHLSYETGEAISDKLVSTEGWSADAVVEGKSYRVITYDGRSTTVKAKTAAQAIKKQALIDTKAEAGPGYWAIPITQELRDSVLAESFSLFQKQEEALGTYDAGSNKITLNKRANESTLMHEFAHFMYENELKNNSALVPGIHKWFKRNGRAIAKEAAGYHVDDMAGLDPSLVSEPGFTESHVVSYLDNGTSGDPIRDRSIRRAVHEQFARGFEAYLREGKAPSLELREVFRKIANALKDIYRSIAQLDVNVDAEMKSIYDRLMATDEQIQYAEAASRLEPLFTDAVMAGMTEEQFAKYKERNAKRKDDSRGKLFEKLVKQLTRQKTKEWKVEKAQLIKQHTDDMQEREPIYKAQAELRTGDIKMALAPVKEAVGQEKTNSRGKQQIVVPSFFSKMTTAKEGGLHPDVIAAMYGFNSGAEMMADMAAADSIKTVAEQRAEAEMVSRHGDILKDGSIEAEAEMAVRTEGMADQLLEELWVLRAAPTRTVTVPAEQRDGITVLGALDYYADKDARIVAHKAKDGDDEALKKMAASMAKNLKEGATLVPIPGRDGTATESLKLASLISEITGSPVADILKGSSREPLYSKKKRGDKVDDDFFGYTLDGEKPTGSVVLVDNVYDTGQTVSAANKVIGADAVLAYSVVKSKQTKHKRKQAPTDKAFLKQLAAERIGGLTYSEIQPHKYRKAELRAAQEAGKALASGDKELAAQHKQTQLLNFYLGRAAEAARKDTDKALKFVSKYRLKRHREAIQKAGNQYWEQLEKIMGRFDLRKSSPKPKKSDGLQAWVIDRVENFGDGLELSSLVMDENNQQHWKELTHDQLLGIIASVQNIDYVARNDLKLTVEEERLDFDLVVKGWTDKMASDNDAHKFTRKDTAKIIDTGKIKGVKEHVRWINSYLSKPAFVARWLDAGEKVGRSTQLLVIPFTNALDAKFKLFESVAVPVIQALKNRSSADKIRHLQKIFIPEMNESFTGNHILSVALNSGNAGNIDKMVRGEGWGDDTTINNANLQAILRHLTKSDWDMVQLIWDQMQLLHDPLMEVYQRSTGLKPPSVQAQELVNEHGTFRGGYYPMKYDPERGHAAEKNEQRKAAEVDSPFAGSSSVTANISSGATYERTRYANKVKFSLSTVMEHFEETIHYITHHEAVKNANRLLADEKVANTITGILGKDELDALRDWVSGIAKDGSHGMSLDFVEQFMRRAKTGTVLGIMGFKVMSGLNQVYGLANAASEVGFVPILKGIGQTVGKARFFKRFRTLHRSGETMQSGWEFAASRSKVMQHRVKTFDRELRREMEKLAGKKGALAKVQEVSMMHLSLIQTYGLDLPTWLAAYDKHVGETGDETTAAQYADSVVEMVHGSGATKEMSRLLRNQSGTTVIFTMFMTAFSAMGNQMRDIYRGSKQGYYSPTEAAAKATYLLLLPVLVEMFLKGELDEPDDDDEYRLQKVLMTMISYGSAAYPLARDAVGTFVTDYGFSLSPIQGRLERGFESASAMFDPDKEFTKSHIKNITKLVGVVAGVPGVDQSWATGESLYDAIVEGEDRTFAEVMTGPPRDEK